MYTCNAAMAHLHSKCLACSAILLYHMTKSTLWSPGLQTAFTWIVLSIPRNTFNLFKKYNWSRKCCSGDIGVRWIYLIKKVYYLSILLCYNSPYFMNIYWILVKWETYCSVIISPDFGLVKNMMDLLRTVADNFIWGLFGVLLW